MFCLSLVRISVPAAGRTRTWISSPDFTDFLRGLWSRWDELGVQPKPCPGRRPTPNSAVHREVTSGAVTPAVTLPRPDGFGATLKNAPRLK
jgi:hypothetical protein